ncbi:MAG: response regulator [Magnetococcus sp. DMHC-6]
MGINGAVSYWIVDRSVNQNAFITMQSHLKEHYDALHAFHSTAQHALRFIMDCPTFEAYFSLPETLIKQIDSQGKLVFSEQQNQFKLELKRTARSLLTHFPIAETCLVDRFGHEHMRLIKNSDLSDDSDDLSLTEDHNPFFNKSLQLNKGETYTSRPYLSPDYHDWVIAYTAPVVLKDESKPAFFHFEIPLQTFLHIATKDGNAVNRYLVVDGSGLLLADSSQQNFSKQIDPTKPLLTDHFPKAKSFLTEISFENILKKQYKTDINLFTHEGIDYQIAYQSLDFLDWHLVMLKPHDHLLEGSLSYQHILTILIATPLFLLLLGALNGLVLAKAIAKPIQSLMNATQQVGQGNLTVVLQVQTNDEIGHLADSFNRMTHDLHRHQMALLDHQEAMRKKDLQLLKLEQANSRAKSDFVANLSHEIRTPMNAILCLTDLAMRHSSDPGTKDYLYKIDTASQSLMGCLNDVLDFSKIEAGKLELYAVLFNPAELFKKLADMFGSQAADKGVELVFVIPETYFHTLFGDSRRLEQVLVNLLRNATKFTNQGTIIVRAHDHPKHVGPVYLHFSVEDTGIGIEPTHLNKLFTPFTQVDASISLQYGGTGLGLNICKQLVELMGGKIWAESVLGKGSVFHFTVTFEYLSETNKILIIPEILRDKKILVADDHELTREIMEEILRGFKFFTHSVDSGEAALSELLTAQANRTPYDLLFLDWRMSGMDGIETAKAIYEKFSLLPVPTLPPKIIMLTAFGKNTVQKTAEQSGIDLFIHKPVTRIHLFNAILEIFNTSSDHIPAAHPKEITSLNAELEAVMKIGGAKILLVEDNIINQQVAKELLERVGVSVTVANHGQEALDYLQQADFDAILMDVQMPIMDGLKATQQIRRHQKWQHLPIIAMTAHVLENARAESLAAGMNDHLTKPIDIRRLFNVLISWINPDGLNLRFGRPPHSVLRPELDTDILPATLNGIDMSSAMERLGGQQKIFKSMLLRFQDHANVWDKIQTALQQQDFLQARNLAHIITGIAGNLSATRLHQAAQKLELALEQERIQQEPLLLLNFQKALQEILATIATLPADPEPVQIALPQKEIVIDQQVVDHLFTELTNYLQTNDTDAESIIETLKTVLTGEIWREDLRKLEELVQRMDYPGALKIIEKMRT